MNLPIFEDITSFSSSEISEAIIEMENQLFNLNFRKATRQNFKSHEIRYTKRRIAQLKTLWSQKFKNLGQKDPN